MAAAQLSLRSSLRSAEPRLRARCTRAGARRTGMARAVALSQEAILTEAAHKFLLADTPLKFSPTSGGAWRRAAGHTTVNRADASPAAMPPACCAQA